MANMVSSADAISLFLCEAIFSGQAGAIVTFKAIYSYTRTSSKLYEVHVKHSMCARSKASFVSPGSVMLSFFNGVFQDERMTRNDALLLALT